MNRQRKKSGHDGPPRLMLVDDDRLVRMVGEGVLAEGGFDVVALASGDEALERLHEVAPDLILLDIMMPGIDGFETCQRIKADPEFANVPIIMLTGADDVDSVGRAYELGAWDFNAKPINWPILVNRCRAALDAHQAFADAREAARLARMIDNAHNEIIEFSAETFEILWVNSAGLQRLADASGEMRRRTMMELLVGFDRKRLAGLVASLGADEPQVPLIAEFRRDDGSTYPVDGLILRMADGDGPPSFCAIVRDISDLRDHQKELFRLQFQDNLTGLPNALQFLRLLDRLIEDPLRGPRQIAVALLDLDGLRVANDALGYAAGDEIIRIIADRITSLANGLPLHASPDRRIEIARRGGDEFMIMVASSDAHTGIRVLAQKVLAEVQRPMTVAGREFAMTGSLGIALFPADGEGADGLVMSAEAAMYKAKLGGGNALRFFAAADSQLSLEKLTIETQLRRAIENDELEIHYQIQVDHEARRVQGLEALVRWQHPERGLLYPGSFLPIAEETSLIVDLGNWVLRRVFADSSSWLGSCLHPDAKISINVSARQFQHERFHADLRAIREEYQARHQIVFELTETAIVEDLEFQHHLLEGLGEFGIQVAIDDFGTGYSSLQYLKRLPVHYLKIDRSFVAGIDQSQQDQQIVEVIFAFAEALGLAVIAEGVETEAQARVLASCGAHLAQGFLFSRGVPKDELVALMAGMSLQLA